jgi:hypothetical protein
MIKNRILNLKLEGAGKGSILSLEEEINLHQKAID